MRKHIKKHHIHLGWATLLSSAAVIIISAIWTAGLIELPASWIYYSRKLSGTISENPDSTIELPLKFHRQEYSLSCEIATLKMVLNFHGIEVSESEIIAKLYFDPTPRSVGVWGNPHEGFVGKIDGKMMVDGYGVYWEPISVIASHWKKAGIIKNGLAPDLAGHVSQGRPVIVWGYLGRGRPVSWKTPEGETVYGINGEHTRVVYGFKGPVDNPEGFFVMDPIYGSAYWDKDVFMRNWDAFGRMGVVVYQ